MILQLPGRKLCHQTPAGPHCERVWINVARNARARRNSQDELHQLNSSALGKPELRLGRDLSETQSDLVAKLQKEGFSWMGWHHKGDTASRICRTIFSGRNGTDDSRMQHQMEEVWNKAKNRQGWGDRLVSKVLPHKHGVLSSNPQDTFKPHMAAVL